MEILAPKIDGILQQSDVELRIAAGEAISVILHKIFDVNNRVIDNVRNYARL